MVDLVINQTAPRNGGIAQEWNPGSLVYPGTIVFADGKGEYLSRNGLTGKLENGTQDASTTFNLVLTNA